MSKRQRSMFTPAEFANMRAEVEKRYPRMADRQRVQKIILLMDAECSKLQQQGDDDWEELVAVRNCLARMHGLAEVEAPAYSSIVKRVSRKLAQERGDAHAQASHH